MFRSFRQFERRFVANFNTDAGATGSTSSTGSAATTDAGDGGKSNGGAADPAARIAALESQIAAFLKAQKGAGGSSSGNQDDPDLQEKARRARESSDKDNARTRQLENALRFNLKSGDFLKQNESLLPKDASDIFRQAEKENFGDAIEKDSAIKSGLIQSFFSVQTNVDLLTNGQKATLDEYLKLTKNEKQNRAQSFYDMVFEPAFEMLKRVKKAEALSKGFGAGSDLESAYKQKLIASTRKHYLGEK